MYDVFARCQFFCYPLFVHTCVVYQKPHWVIYALPLLYALQVKRWRLDFFCGLLGCAVLSAWWQNHVLIFLPPILITLMILWPFAVSVRRHRTPLLTRFYQLTETEAAPEMIRYTTRLTWVWVGLISLMLIETIALGLFAPLTVWSLMTNFVNYVLLILFMILEFLFRMLYFRRWFSPSRFIKQLIIIDHRKLL